MVILTYCGNNEIEDMSHTSAYEEIETYINRKKGIIAFLSKTNTFKLMANAYKLAVVLGKALRRRMATGFRANNSLSSQAPANPSEQRQKNLLAKYKEYLIKMRTITKENDIEFVLALLPSTLRPNDRKSLVSLKQYTKEQNIHMVDYSPIFNNPKNQKEKPSFLPIDSHPSPYGHKMMALSLKNLLINKKIVE